MRDFLAGVFSGQKTHMVIRNLRLCAAALPAAQVWNKLPSDERRELLKQAVPSGAAGWVALLATLEFARQHMGVQRGSLESLDRDTARMVLEGAASFLESLRSAPSPPPPIAVQEVVFVDEEDDEKDEEGEEEEDDENDEEDPPRWEAPRRGRGA